MVEKVASVYNSLLPGAAGEDGDQCAPKLLLLGSAAIHRSYASDFALTIKCAAQLLTPLASGQLSA